MSGRRALTGTEIADLMIQMGRLAHAEASEPALTATQWTALRYFARANLLSRTVSAFADYHATTRGTVSQTIKTLIEKGYLSRERSAADGRSAYLHLTPKGQQAIAADPLARLAELIETLPPAAREALAAQLQQLAGSLADAVERPRFGICGQCRFLMARRTSLAGNSVCHCAQLDANLEPGDLGRLCQNFVPA